jgi:hypothetical protein
MMYEESRLDELTKEEWWEKCRKVIVIPRTEFEKLWADFQQRKLTNELHRELH